MFNPNMNDVGVLNSHRDKKRRSQGREKKNILSNQGVIGNVTGPGRWYYIYIVYSVLLTLNNPIGAQRIKRNVTNVRKIYKTRKKCFEGSSF